MENLVKYCCDKGLHNFVDFKLQRKSKVIMKEHYISRKDIIKYNLFGYIQVDKYGKFKLPKYFLRKISNLISDLKSGYLGYKFNKENPYKNIKNYNDIKNILLNPNEELIFYFNTVKENLDKDILKSRINKIIVLKNKLKNYDTV